MRGRTGHENKTGQHGEHLITAFTPHPLVSIEYVAGFLPQPSFHGQCHPRQIGAGRSCARTAFVWCQLCVPRKLKLHGRAAAAQRSALAIRLRIWKMWRWRCTPLDAGPCVSICEQKCIDRCCICWEWLPAYRCDGGSGLDCRCTWISIGVALHEPGSASCIFAKPV